MSQRLLILLDDEPVTSRALALDLADAGYRVSTAADPREVLRRFRTEPIDLLIADEGGGSEDGQRVVEEVRRIRPAAKVLLMTTRPEAERGAGSVTRIRKPFDLEEFRATVGRLLELEEGEEGKKPARRGEKKERKRERRKGKVKETNGSAR